MGIPAVVLLHLLEDGPKHGYDIIKALTDRFGGTYSPSASSVYPRLAKLQDEGLVTTRQEGRRNLYGLTADGRLELDQRAAELTATAERYGAANRPPRRRPPPDATPAQGAGTPPTGPVPARSLRELEHQLDDFRGQLRADLRTAATRSGVDEAAYATIKAVLDQAKSSIRAVLR